MNYEILKSEIMGSDYDSLREAQNYPGIAAKLNERPLLDNPVPQGNIPKPLTLSYIFSKVAAVDIPKLNLIPGWIVDRVEQAMNSNDRVSLANYLATVEGQLSQTSQAALSSALSETVPDPNWNHKISGQSRAQVLGIDPVMDSDVQMVLNL